MKKFVLILLAAFIAVGAAMAQPKTSITLVSEGLFVPNDVTDRVNVESWDSLYARVAGQGLSPYLSMATGLGARDGAIIGYWGHVGLGIQGGKTMFWSAGMRLNLVDIAFGLEGSLGGLIDIGGGTQLRLEGTGDLILPFVDKTFVTKNDDDYISFGLYPKIGFVLKDGFEIGATFNLFMENRVVASETNTDIRFGPYFRWGKGELSLFGSWNRWNRNSDGDPAFVPGLKLGFTL